MRTSLKIEGDVHHAGVAHANAQAYRAAALTRVLVAVASFTIRAELGASYFPEDLGDDAFLSFLCHGSKRFFEAVRLSDRVAFHISYVDEKLVLRINITKAKESVYLVELNFQAENKFDDGKFTSVTIRRHP